jgi:hypothetical protein
MFIDEKRFWISRSIRKEQNGCASYKHFAGARLVSDGLRGRQKISFRLEIMKSTTRMMAARAYRPLSRARNILGPFPGACAPGFTLATASQAEACSFIQLP